MIKRDATLSIRIIPLEALQVKEYQRRYPNMLDHYVQLLQEHPGQYAGLLHVVPSDTHPGMYAILDGHTRYCASIMDGRHDALCLVVEDAA